MCEKHVGRMCVAVAVALLALLVLGHLQYVLLPADRSPYRITRDRMEHRLPAVILSYEAAKGEVPVSEKELASFVDGGRGSSRHLLDGWGRPIVVLRAQDVIILVSGGADGSMNTNDDIVRLLRWFPPTSTRGATIHLLQDGALRQ